MCNFRVYYITGGGFKLQEKHLVHQLSGVGPDNNTARDRLFYIADMISELKEMAEKDRCGTLAGLLALAENEALRKAGE